MRAARGLSEEEAAARATIQNLGQSPSEMLRALSEATSLGLEEIGTVTGRSAFTVRRWKREKDAVVPVASAAAIEDLRTIVAMLVEAGHSKRSITSFLRSRNPGLGRDRPLDGLRSDVSEFARVEHVTQCFIDGIAPEQGRHVLIRPTDDRPVQIVDGVRSDPGPGDPGESVAQGDKAVDKSVL